MDDKLYFKHELARLIGVDSRVVARVGMLPDGTSKAGRPMYSLEHAKAQLDAWLKSNPDRVVKIKGLVR